MKILTIIFVTIIVSGCKIFIKPELRPHSNLLKLRNIQDTSIVFENENVKMQFSKFDLKENLEQVKYLNKCDSLSLVELKKELNLNWNKNQFHFFQELENNQDVGIQSNVNVKQNKINLEIKIIHNLLQNRRAIIFNKAKNETVDKIQFAFEEGGNCCCSKLYKFEDGRKIIVYRNCVDFVVNEHNCN
jgi:hypothetical protein